MTKDELRRAVRATPIKPFRIRMASGRGYEVEHPEFVAIAPHRRTIAVSSMDDRAFDPLNMTLIRSLEFRKNGTGRWRGKAG